jgi:hypothetical protein
MPDKINPVAFQLVRICWSVFGTLTWDRDAATWNNEHSEKIRQTDFHRLVGNTCGRLRLRSRELAVYAKTEWGEGERGHYNFLIGRQGTKNVSPKIIAATMLGIWLKEHGRAKIEPFDAIRQWQGVKYQSKLESDVHGQPICPAEFISTVLRAMIRKNSSESLSPRFTPAISRKDFTFASAKWHDETLRYGNTLTR